MNDVKKYYCLGGCGKEVERSGDRCPACQDRFDMICNRYRAVYNSAKDKDDLKDKLNKFRAGVFTQIL